MAELADVQDLGSCVLWACGFDSHYPQKNKRSVCRGCCLQMRNDKTASAGNMPGRKSGRLGGRTFFQPQGMLPADAEL